MTPAAYINTISTKKFNTPAYSGAGYVFSKIPENTPFARHPADVSRYCEHIESGKDKASFVDKYERFEFRMTDGRTFGAILKGTLDVSDANIAIFKTDADLYDTIAVAGAPQQNKYEYIDKTTGKRMRRYYERTVVVDYIKIDVIEFVTVVTEEIV